MKRKNTPEISQAERIEPAEEDERDATDSSAKKETDLSRRRFLIVGSGAAASVIIAEQLVRGQQPGSGQGGGRGQGSGRGQGRGRGSGAGQGGRQTRAQLKAPRVSALNESNSSFSPPFCEPEAACARTVNGQSVLNLTLNVEMTTWRFTCDGQTSYGQIPIYNGAVPGPTMYVDPGSRLSIVMNNRLPTQSPWSGDHCGQMKMDGTQPTPAECFMHTNLHTHGLMVSPSSILTNGKLHCVPSPNNCGPVDSSQITFSSDDVLADIAPGGKNNYCIVLPDFHEPGTYWYHAHTHGSTGYQVSSGMAGTLVIREPVGQELVQDDRDKVFLMQEVIFTPTGTNNPAIPPVYTEQSTTQFSAGFLINGLCRPTLQLKTGQTQRWRFVNATGTPRGLMKLRLIKMSNDPQAVIDDTDIFDCGQDPTGGGTICLVKPALVNRNAIMNLIAVDGISFYGFPPQPVRQHLIASGNRADFLINIPTAQSLTTGPGKYVLVKDGFPKDGFTYNLNPSLTDKVQVGLTLPPSMRTTQVLAYIEVYPLNANEPVEKLPTIIPGKRPDYLQAIGAVTVPEERVVTFNAANKGGPGGGQFSIDGKFYDPTNLGIVAKLNTAEQWLLQNSGNDIPHPFHIHVNPFQIGGMNPDGSLSGRTIDFEVDAADRKGPPLDKSNPCNWIWQDTVAIPSQYPPPPGPPPPGPIGQLRLRTRFLNYPGEYVLHCHILIHEDLGMMTNVTIQDDGNGVGPCVTLPTYPPASADCIKRTMTTPKCST